MNNIQDSINDTSALHTPRTNKGELEKLRDMSFMEKVNYLWSYYKEHAFTIIMVVLLAAYIIYSIAKPKVKTRLYVALINNTAAEEDLDELSESLVDYLSLNSERESVFLNPAFYFLADKELTMNVTQALMVYIMASEIDIIIAPESYFRTYSEQSFFSNLSNELPTDLYSRVSDLFVFGTTVDEDVERVYGLNIGETEFYKDLNNPEDPYILGVLENSPHKENAFEAIRYLISK